MLKKIIFVSLVLMFVFASIFFVFNFSLAQFGLENFGSGSDNTFFSANQSVPETVTRIISIIIGIIGVLLLVLLIYGGVLYATSAGGEQIETAKKVLTYAIIGIIIVALSFAITNYVIVGLFADDYQPPGGSGTGGTGTGGTGTGGTGTGGTGTGGTGTGGTGTGGTGGNQPLSEELLREGRALVQEGEDMVSRGEELCDRGKQLVEEGNEEAGQILINDGEELINGGNAKIEEGNALLAEVDVDCKHSGDRCGILRNFCCSYLECDGAITDSGWPRFAGECASGNPECKEEGERCVTLGQDCCGGLNCLEGYCAN